jgi:aspartate-semialdehyde dehydrogenase
MTNINIAVVGATGLVGGKIISILQESKIEFGEARFFASARSAGRKIRFFDDLLTVENLQDQTAETLKGIDIAIFSAGGQTSLDYAPIFAEAGATVIDNSSAWRMDNSVPLVVAGVNNDDLPGVTQPEIATTPSPIGATPSQAKGNMTGNKIIANPNCTTMAIMPILKPLADQFKLESLLVSTYQAVSGAGIEAIGELRRLSLEQLQYSNDDLISGNNPVRAEYKKFVEPIGFEPIAMAGNFVDDGTFETDEEQKLRNESRKILHLENLRVAGTCVRVPSFNSHCLSVTAKFNSELAPSDVVKVLQTLDKDYVTFADDNNPILGVPTPYKTNGKNPTMIGRIRNDFSLENPKLGIQFFVSSDNLRLGAALNTVRIAELLSQ